MNVEALLAKAAEAKPNRPRKGKWAQLYPVYARLLEQGFTREGAVGWLVEEGALAKSEAGKARNALIQVHFRTCLRAGKSNSKKALKPQAN